MVVRRGSGWLLAATTVLLLSGCSSTGATGTSGSSAPPESSAPESSAAKVETSSVPPIPTTSPSADQPAVSATADSPPATGDVLVEFSRQGGIRGVSDHLIVLEDGALTVTRNRPAASQSGQLSPTELSDLRQQLDTLSATQPSKVNPVKGNDLYSYQVIYRGSKILAEQGSVPPAVEPVLAYLAGIVAAYGS